MSSDEADRLEESTLIFLLEHFYGQRAIRRSEQGN